VLFYKGEATKRWTCGVAKRLPDGAFLITVYPTWIEIVRTDAAVTRFGLLRSGDVKM